MKLVEELHTALMMLRGSFAQLIPQDQSHTLGKITSRFGNVQKIITLRLNKVSNDVCLP